MSFAIATSVSPIMSINSGRAAICRVIAIDEEDSRECPSQHYSEIEREDIFDFGIDERNHHRGHSDSSQNTTKHLLYNMYSRRVSGLRRQCYQGKAFRERRDCSSFDSHDSDTEDECGDRRSTTLPYRQPMVRKPRQHVYQHNSPKAKGGTLPMGTKGNAASATYAVTTLCGQENNNKRKTPSPVFGLEPAPVSAEPLYTEVMCIDEQDNESGDAYAPPSAKDEKQLCEVGFGNGNDYDGNKDEYKCLPSPSRRISLSPVSRRLALQFDSISFYAVEPSRPKRRKTCDTSVVCPQRGQTDNSSYYN